MKLPGSKLLMQRGVRLLGVMLLVLAGAALLAGCGGGDEEEQAQPTPAPTATPEPKWPPGSSAPIARIVIPRLQIDAPITVKGVDATGAMENPNGASDVAWYDFSGKPGFDEYGNAVFSGHVDYIGIGPAVFWRVRELNPEDQIEVHLEDGTVYRYVVRAKDVYPADEAPVGQIVGPTPEQSVTLITCEGVFSPESGLYDQRLVVRAERIA